MNRLPTETVAEIVSQLKAILEKNLRPHHRLRLAPYSTINRTWQEVIEHETFRDIRKINVDNLPELTAILSGSTGDRRIHSIRSLEFRYIPIRMPPLAPTQHIERREQERVASESFSEDIRVLFALLKGWEERLDGGGGVAGDWYQLRLFLGMGYLRRVADLPLPPRMDEVFGNFVMRPLPGDPPEDPVVPFTPRADVRYIGEEILPELSIVSSMILYYGHEIHPESLLQIISRMKCLVSFEGTIFEENASLELTREYRKVLAQCLHLLPRSLNVFRPNFPYAHPDPHTSYSVLVDPQRDHLCLVMRALSGQLQKLLLKDLRISSAIFAGDCYGSYPDWSRLENLVISYPVISSTGQWFATVAPPEEVTQDDPDDYDDRIYYSIPEPKLLNELYAAAGKAKQHMPSLRYMELTLNIDPGQHIFSYGFNHLRKRDTISLESDVVFEFSNEVAEAWGFSLDEVDSLEGKTFTEILLT